MERIAVFPGSFDPITRGHESIIRRGAKMFDKIIVAIGQNSNKQYFFPLDQRIEWLEKTFSDSSAIQTDVYEGLTVDYCRKINASFIIRGIRTSADFEFERSIAQVNRKMLPGLETVFLLAEPEFDALSSSIVREIIRHKGDIRDFVPEVVADSIESDK